MITVRSAPTDDLSQSPVNAKLIVYLTALGRDPRLIAHLKDGQCSGIASVTLYAFWLETQPIEKDPQGNAIPRDDLTWLIKTKTILIRWNGDLKTLTVDDHNNINRLLSLIRTFQFPQEYSLSGQGNFDELFFDTRGRTATCEFMITGCFRVNDFFKPFNINYPSTYYYKRTTLFNVITQYEGDLILISSCNHEVGLFSYGENYFINANFKKLFKNFSKISGKLNLIQHIFTASKYYYNIPSPFAIRIFSLNKHGKKYESSLTILQALNPHLRPTLHNYAMNKSSLHLAASIGDVTSAQYYLDQKSDINALTTSQTTPIFHAIIHQRLRMVAFLIANGARVAYKIQNMPLFFYATNNRDILNLLIKHGISIWGRDENGCTALHHSASEGNTLTTAVLIAQGLDISLKNKDNETALDFAIQKQHFPVIRQLLQAGAKISSHKAEKLLLQAVFIGHTQLVSLLLKMGVNPDATTHHYGFNTALHYATEKGYVDIIKILIDAKANINAVNYLGETPLFNAMKNSLFNLIPELIKLGADLSFHGIDLLFTAAIHGKIQVVQELINRGIDINTKDAHGFTPLHCAVMKHEETMVRFLLAKGAKRSAKTNQGLFPQDLTVQPSMLAILCSPTLVNHSVFNPAAKRQGVATVKQQTLPKKNMKN